MKMVLSSSVRGAAAKKSGFPRRRAARPRIRGFSQEKQAQRTRKQSLPQLPAPVGRQPRAGGTDFPFGKSYRGKRAVLPHAPLIPPRGVVAAAVLINPALVAPGGVVDPAGIVHAPLIPVFDSSP